MKHFIYILLIFLTSITACQQRTAYPLAIQQAEALMNTRPDSALTLLESIADTLAMLPEEARMYHSLLTIQAKDKQYITHTSDSLINRIVSFYENNGDSDRLMMAYFYQGSTYRDMNDAPRALKAFQQAVDLNVPNLDLLAKTYNQMGTLFMYQGLHDEVIQVNRKAIEAYLSLGKRHKISYFQRDIARMYDMKNISDSALFYYKEACHTALNGNDSIRHNEIFSEMGGFLYKKGNLHEAKHILARMEQSKYIRNKAHIYSILGHIYDDQQLWDSAYYYKTKVLENGSLDKMYSSYVGLSHLEQRKGNFKKAYETLRKAIRLNDSIHRTTQPEAIAKINALYNYQHTEAENTRLMLEKEKQKSWTLVMLILLISIISTSVGIIFRQKQKKEQALSRAEKRRKLEEERYQSSQAAIRDNEQKIKELDLLLENAKRKNDHLQQELFEAQQQKLKAHNEAIVQWNKEQKIRLTAFKTSDIYKEILQASKDEEMNMTPLKQPGKWVIIQEHIDSIYPDFTGRLHKLCPSLSDTDVQVCYLAKMGITPSGIGRVLKLSRQAISNIRKRIMQKIGATTGETSNFDHFIEEF